MARIGRSFPAKPLYRRLIPLAPPLPIYSRGAYATLPTNAAALTTPYSTAEVTTVSTVNNTTDVTLVNGLGSGVHEFAVVATLAQRSLAINITWQGEVSQAPSSATVFLQIYNLVTPGWETLATNTTASANTIFTMTATQSTSLSSYFDGSGYCYVRVYQ